MIHKETVIETVKLQDSGDLLDWLAQYYKRPDLPDGCIPVEDNEGDCITCLKVVETTLSDKSTRTSVRLISEFKEINA